jgi:plastocyanin
VNQRLFLSALALLAGSVSVGTASRPRMPVAHTVVIEGMQFQPATLEIRSGDSVTWINKDIVDHTATTRASSTRRFDSRLIGVGKTWKRTFKEAGTHDYLCTYHPTMEGVIKVTASGSAAPLTSGS